jgi:uncharacterized protein YlxW (UPF0749 family)
VQTRPGNEPEREPESADGDHERDPFTPKVRPETEDADGPEAESPEPEAPEAEAEAEGEPGAEAAAEEPGVEADLAETMDLRSLEAEKPKAERKKHRGQMSSETLKAQESAAEGGDEAGQSGAGGESESAESETAAESGSARADKPAEGEPARADKAAEGQSARPEEPAEAAAAGESAQAERRAGAGGEREPAEAAAAGGSAGPEKAAEVAGEPEPEPPAEAPDLSETVNLRDLFPEEPAAEKSPADKPSAEKSTAETVNLRGLLPEDSAKESPKEPPKGPEGEPPLRRRTPGEPPRRRPAPGPGGQPPRRPAPGQDPRRAGHPQPNEPGPRRRPGAEPRPGVAPVSPAAAAVAASAASGPSASGASGAPGKPAKPAAAPSVSLGRRRLFAALWPPRLSRNQAVVGVLLAALGAALAIQVRATNTSDEILRGARADDLVNILDEVTSRGQSLDAELRTLETQNAAIQDSADKAQAALAQAQQKAKDLQILAGTVKAKGSGITMSITDPQGQLKSATLLNALEELRAAGAEVVQVDDVRVVVSSSFVDTSDGGIALDGHELAKPYVYKVIGDPNTLGPAMQIPGGVVATVKTQPGANVTITPGQVLVDALAPAPSPDYAKAG